MPSILYPATKREYLALVRAFPLASIRDDEHLADALAVIGRLTEKPARSAAEEMYLGALTDLVETYERAHVAMSPVSGTVASLAGAAGSLEQPVSWDEMRDIAREDRHLESKIK